MLDLQSANEGETTSNQENEQIQKNIDGWEEKTLDSAAMNLQWKELLHM